MTTSGSKPRVYIGPISEGTLRNEDLINIFFDELSRLNIKVANELSEKFEFSEEFDYNSEEAVGFLSELTEALATEAPPFTTFGAHEGDGACFGFWPMDPKEIRDFNGDEVIFYDASDSLPEFILLVNDHGNMTLFKVTLEEIWSTV